MQTVVTAPVLERPTLAIRLETVAYLAVIALALVLRLASLGAVPMAASETHNALAAFRVVVPEASGEPLTATSPLLFAVQALAFAVFGTSEFTARLFTALGGAVLVLTPLLFRRELGSTRAFVFAVLLAVSPVGLVAARFSAPVIWSMLSAIALLWALLRLRGGDDAPWIKVVAAVSGGSLIFLSEAGGLLLALMLLGALGIVTVWERRAQTFNFAEAEAKSAATSAFVGARFGTWGTPLLVAGAFVILVATGTLLNPSGLNAVGEVFAGFGRGFTQAPDGAITPFALYVSLFYEPFWWALALAGVVVLINRQSFTLIDRFLAAWLVMALIGSLVFVGAEAYHALWFTIPLIGLTTSAVMAMLKPVRETEIFAPPAWARWVIALAFIAVLVVFTVSAQALGRSLLTSTSESLATATLNANSVILVIVSIMFLIIGFFLVASVWGNTSALQGVGLGVLIFGAITSLGSGWGAAVSEADSPREPFHFYATSTDVLLLRETLHELAERNSGGFNVLPLSVMAPQDGVIAWVVRDFTQAEYITDLRDALGDQVVLLPAFDDPPALGTSYVGQDFITARTWTPLAIYALDVPTWWMQRHARFTWMTLESTVLWLRQDIYEGVEPQDAAG
ncbi:MAG: hypothetical protein J0M07_03185 [Anaerolineae bacterium]|nr:hypothetical protein [Anaerolineae bacterium]